MPKRFPAAVLAGALLAGLVSCGSSSGGTRTAGPDTAPAPVAPPVRTVAGLTPVVYDDPFVGVQDAAAHMPSTAKALAAAFAEADEVSGETGSPAATLRADLTQLLTGHVYLTGIAAATAYATEEPDGEQTTAARAVVGENAKNLAQRVGKLIITDPEAAAETQPDATGEPSTAPDGEQSAPAEIEATRKGFHTAWLAQIDDLNAFAGAAFAKDDGEMALAQERLEQHAANLGRFFAEVTARGVRRSDVRDAFEGQFLALTDAIDALADGGRKAYQKLVEAAARAADIAAVIAGGLAAGNDVDGDTGDDGAQLRAELTATLGEHVYLATMTVLATLTGGQEAGANTPAVTAAKVSLDDNSKKLAAAVGTIADPQAEFAFLTAWRTHINDFLDYAAGLDRADESITDRALTRLSAYRRSAGALLAEATDSAISAATVTEALTGHIQSFSGAIDALAAALAPQPS